MSKRVRNELRAEMKKILGNLDDRWLRAASRDLCKHLTEVIEKHSDRRIENILAWTSFFPGEVDLAQFISGQVEQREVYLPRSLPSLEMTFLSIGKNWVSDMAAGEYGILEPVDSSGICYDPATQAQTTAVIVPGLAYDRLGNRLGRGKGYYDRFLGSEAMRSALRIGVGWDLQLVQEIPSFAHDVPVHWFVSEEKAYDLTLVEETV